MFGTSEPTLSPLPSALKQKASSIISSISTDRLRRDVTGLIGTHNRIHSPQAMVKAEGSIIAALKDAGWQARRRPFSVRQAMGNLDYGYFSPTAYPELSGVNITAVKAGQESNNTLVVEAHYDTVRMSPGADDNIASVAALLELARILKPCSFKHSVMLACCDMEELGFIGAFQLVKELTTECKVRGAIIFETMAYTSKEPNSQSFPPGFERIYPGQTKRLEKRGFTGEGAIVIYRNSSKSLAVGFSESMIHVAGPDSVMLLREPSDIPVVGQLLRRRLPATINHFYRADQVPFWEAGIPAVQVTDGADFRNPHYHKISDKPDTLDYEHLANIVAATAIAILRMDSK